MNSGEWSKKGLPQPLTLVYICCILHVRFTGIAAIPSSQQIVYTGAPLRDQQLPRYSYTQSLKQSPNINTSCVDKPTPSRGFSSSVKNCSLYFFFYKELLQISCLYKTKNSVQYVLIADGIPSGLNLPRIQNLIKHQV